MLEARRQARESLGRDPNQADLFGTPPKRASQPIAPALPTWTTPRPADRPDESYGALFLGEAASRLNISRNELEAMIAAGKVGARDAGYTRVIPTREVERLLRR